MVQTVKEIPMWVSILSPTITVISFIGSILMWRKTISYSKKNILAQITQQANEINEALAKYHVPGPYAVILQPQNVNQYLEKSLLVFQHISLLRKIFENSDVIGDDKVKGYEKWVKNFVIPWLDSDKDNLYKTWDTYKKGDFDIGHKKFIDWLEQIEKEYREEMEAKKIDNK